MLADVRCRDENLSERDGVVGQEEQAEKFLGVRVLVNDARDVDDEANGELGDVVYVSR